MTHFPGPRPAPEILKIIREGAAIPAHPLALASDGSIDTVSQRALTRYYLDAGANGIAVGVHTTQFAIREAGLYRPVLELAAETKADWATRDVALVAGVTGETDQALREIDTANQLGYDAALLNVAKLKGRKESEILEHCRLAAQMIPIIGFSLLPECGGFHLSYDFWREFAQIDGVIAIKMAPFNRYRTLEIIRAVVDARAEDRVTLYTGNDDHIILDLISPFLVKRDGLYVSVRVRGGLLGQWSVWTHKAVALLEQIRALDDAEAVPADLLALDSILTECNNAIYDAQHDFAGCVPGGLEVLRRQGLVEDVRCLDPDERLGEGQFEAINRVYRDYPEMNDDDFVANNRDRWLHPNRSPIVALR